MTREEFLAKVGPEAWATLQAAGFDVEPCACGCPDGWVFFHAGARAMRAAIEAQYHHLE